MSALTEVAERVARTRDTAHRIEVTGSDDIARLAASFNTMLDELDQALTALSRSLSAQRQLVADASHELRTPLTGLRSNIDLLARADRLEPRERAEIMTALRTQMRELSDLVGDLIDLARGDAEVADDREAVRLDHVVEHCADSARKRRPDLVFAVDAEPTPRARRTCREPDSAWPSWPRSRPLTAQR